MSRPQIAYRGPPGRLDPFLPLGVEHSPEQEARPSPSCSNAFRHCGRGTSFVPQKLQSVRGEFHKWPESLRFLRNSIKEGQHLSGKPTTRQGECELLGIEDEHRSVVIF